MCGIVGVTSKKEFSSKKLIDMLKRLEYRGYDSFGFATNSGYMEKFVGEIDSKKIKNRFAKTEIAQTRWATHGGVSEKNAHPHADCSSSLFIVHNGIISNYEKLKGKLKGHKFRSDTDSEVIAHYIEEKLKRKDMLHAIADFFRDAQGEFAVLLIRKNDGKMYAFKRGSPMVLGIDKDGIIVASDIFAFSNRTNKAVFFNENDLTIVSPTGYEFYKMPMLHKERREIHIIPQTKEEQKHKYEHYMIKEIMEQPLAAQRLINSLNGEQHKKIQKLKQMIKSSRRIVFVASGSSYHASLMGVYFLRRAGIEAHTIIASEFRNFTLLDDNTLAIAISQSGETMDVIEALHGIKEKGVKIASFVNVPYSTIERMSNVSINTCAGPEICVAATKTLTNQFLALLYLASAFGYKTNMEKIPGEIRKFLAKNDIKSIARSLKNNKDMYIIGRGFSYPISREIALKLKEIAYVHAEGMMGGELKHGTLALIEKGTPVIALMPCGDGDIASNVKEVEARGARVISIGGVSKSSSMAYRDSDIKIHARDEAIFGVLATVAGQMLTYYIAKEKKLPIDKPRNLAKCVSVK